MGTLLVAKEIFPAHFVMILKLKATRLQLWPLQVITKSVQPWESVVTGRISRCTTKIFSGWADTASKHPPKNSGFVLVILKSGEFTRDVLSQGQRTSFVLFKTTQAIKKTLHFEFMNPINFPRKSPSLLLNHSLGRDNHTSHPWRRENHSTALEASR